MARIEGIVLEVEGVASAIVSTKPFGRGEKRRRALARIEAGSVFEARVVAYHPEGRQLSLEPVEAALQEGTVVSAPFGCSAKAGKVLLFDVANILGDLGPERAARKLVAIRNGAEEQGWRTRFFWEREGFTRTAKIQATEGQLDALRRFIRESHVELVEGEADWALLETCRALPDSFIVTRDRFTDKDQFPGIVGTRRVRPFFYKKKVGGAVFGVAGLLKAISIDLEDGEGETSESTAVALAQGECLLRRGEEERAARVFEQLANRGVPEGYAALEDMYVATDRKRAKRISRAERRQVDKARDLARRQARRRAWRRSGVGLGGVRRVVRSRWAEKANWRSLCA